MPTRLITDNQIFEIVPITKNVKITTGIVQCITLAQEQYIQNELGDELYEVVLNEYSTNTVTPRIQALLDLILPALAWGTYLKLIVNNYAQTTNAGTVNLTSDKSVAVEQNTLEWVRGEINSNLGYYLNRLKKFLIKNTTTYPEYPYECEQGSGVKRYFMTS